MNETIAVRQGEELDKDALHRFLMKAVTDYPKQQSLEIKQFPSGASNLTYLLSNGDWQAVLRRPPLGPLPPKAHDMKREHDFLSALAPSFSYAPKPLGLGEGTEVMDAVFYVMERRHGVVLDTAFPAHIKGTVAEAKRVSELLIDTLVELHQIDPVQAGLGNFGKPDRFMERQVHGWIGRYEKAQTEEVAVYPELASWLKAGIPSKSEARIIHNDFKFNNMLFSEDLTEVRAVVDWEMATVGDPLFDLGVVLSYWTEPSDSEELRRLFPTITMNEGFLSRRELVKRYEEKIGRDCSELNFYHVFALFKLAVIVQQIYYRWYKGQTTDRRFEAFGERTKVLMNHAWQQISEK